MDIITKSYETPKGLVEGVQVKWAGFNILLAAGSKGFLACGCFDLDVIDRFGVACAIPESTPDNPIGTLERFGNRKIMKINKKAEAMGMRVGMPVTEAFALIA
jgi:uncharacterized protein YunC (DUF1805 family)